MAVITVLGPDARTQYRYDTLTLSYFDMQGNRVPNPNVPDPEVTGARATLLETIQTALNSSFTPAQVTDLINNVVKPGLNKGLNEFEIMAALRGTDTWKAAYPEWQQRIDNGFVPMTEAEIRSRRDEMRMVARTKWGFTPTNDQLSKLISNDVTPDEWGHRLDVFRQIKDLGPNVLNFFAERGKDLSDDDLYEFFDPTIDTAELDREYESARYRAAPMNFGFSLRPEEEETLLRQWGIDPNTAIQNYAEIGRSLAPAERWDAIDRAMGNLEGLPEDASAALAGQGVPYATLFRAINLGDPDALQRLRTAMQRGKARETKGGGVAFKGTAASSLLPSGNS